MSKVTLPKRSQMAQPREHFLTALEFMISKTQQATRRPQQKITKKPEKAKSTSSNESEEKPPVTHVLLISWKVETVVHEEQALLGSIFYEDYGFPLHSLRLNSWDPPDEQLAAKLKEIDDQLGPDDWLIVHYGGHGGLSVDMSFRISAYIPRALLGWKIVQNQLSKLSCNILLLLDCCYATSVILCAEESFDHRPMEIIVASGSPGLAFSSRHHFRLSFTDKLRAVLKDTANSDRDLTISDLYNQVLQRTVIENCQTRPRWREEERAACPILPTPVHISFPAKVPKRALYTLNQPFCGPRPGRYERDPDEWSEDEDEDEYPRGRKNSDNCSATSGPATSTFNNRGGRVIQESKDVKGKGPEDSQSEGSSSPPLEVAQRARRPY